MASAIDPTHPATGVAVSKAKARANWAAAKAELDHGGFAEGMTPTSYGAATSKVVDHLAAIDAALANAGNAASTFAGLTDTPGRIAANQYLRGNADGTELVFVAGAPGDADASTTNYTPAGTGTQTRTVKAKLDEARSVTDYGAVGDGSTNNTAAIQAALDSGAPVVTFPGTGIYLTGPLTISAPIVLHLGRATLRLADGSDGALLTIAASNVSVYDGILDGNGANVTSSTGIRINHWSVARENILLCGIEVKNTESHGIRSGVGSSDEVNRFLTIERCVVHDTGLGGSSGHGISLAWKCPSARVIGNRIYATARNGIWIGNASDDLVVAYNDISEVGRFGAEIWGQKDPPFPPRRVLVHGNKIRDGAAINSPLSVDFCWGVIVSENHLHNWNNNRAALEVVECHGAVIVANRVENVTGRGIQLDETDDGTVANNHVEDSGTTGIRLVNRALRALIIGNRVVNPGTSAIESGNNVSDDASIIGNTLLGGEYGWFRSGGDAHRMLFAGNRLIGQSIAGIRVSHNQDDSRIVDNFIIGESASAVGINVSTGLQRPTISGNTVVGFGGVGGIGIKVDGSSIADAVVEGNRVQDCATGLRLSAPATVVRDNDLRGATTRIDFGSNATDPIIRGNLGYVTEARGTAMIADSSSSVAVTHGLSATPTSVTVTPRANGTVWVSARGATAFTVSRSGSSGGLAFDWKAEV